MSRVDLKDYWTLSTARSMKLRYSLSLMEARMPWRTEYREGKVIRKDGARFVRIPDDYVLEGEEVTIRQD